MSHFRHIFRLLPALILLSLFAVGCRTQRKAVEVVPAETKWERMQVPITLSLTSPQKMSVSGTLNMVRDTSVVISLRMIGMEVAVIAIDSENVTVLDKFNKHAYQAPLARIMGELDITIGQLQDIITGASDITLPPNLGKRITATVDITDEGLVRVLTFYPPKKIVFDMDVTSKEPTPYGKMTQSADIRFFPKGKEVDCGYTLNLAKAKWNSEVTPRHITIPSGYKLMDFDETMKMLTK